MARTGEREEWSHLIVDGARGSAMLTIDLVRTITSWSPGAEAVFGWSAEAALGRDGAMTFTAEERAAGQPARERASRAEGSASYSRGSGDGTCVPGGLTGCRTASILPASTPPLSPPGRGRRMQGKGTPAVDLFPHAPATRPRTVVAVAASLGGIDVLKALLGAFPAAFLVMEETREGAA